MYYLFLTMFLTLVIYNHRLLANPHQDIDSQNIELQSERLLDSQNNLRLEDSNLTLTQPQSRPPSVNSTHELYYPYNQSLLLRMGSIIDLHQFESDFSRSFGSLYGFQYLLPASSSSQVETGADFVKSRGGLLHLAHRWTPHKHSSFRFFYKLGVLMQVSGKEQLATFANHKNYFAKATVGFEDSFRRTTNVRFDLECAVNIEEFLLFLTFGYSWGF